MRRTVPAAIAFGSNVGDRAHHIEHALERLRGVPGVVVRASSSVRETDPVGGPPQGRFLNGVALIDTTLDPEELLQALLGIERAGGRTRAGAETRDAPRTIDLDLVFHGDAVRDTRDLTLPHPRAHERAFVLEPLCEVAPAWTHPRLRRTARELWDEWRRQHAHR